MILIEHLFCRNYRSNCRDTKKGFDSFCCCCCPVLQMMNISFWNTRQKSPKLHLTVGKKGRYLPSWCFFESNILLMILPSFCKCNIFKFTTFA